ncbi:hypothetical protein Isop_1619 [Isosphaera pallida ATCC 43644]|uniref:Outer membrane efflux protein n=1 Tax=Isosphaera pallida (strain ATCC 43644 / DSM 9630 / IS1B) TaxID=575540 RepID=E8QZR7_ISOPI|nr:TolC family protein [Isosphaera pallida]ADV62203.1 hypothetical protein Isop_1619 [Isosphaera pallida ATCC 43644]
MCGQGRWPRGLTALGLLVSLGGCTMTATESRIASYSHPALDRVAAPAVDRTSKDSSPNAPVTHGIIPTRLDSITLRAQSPTATHSAASRSGSLRPRADEPAAESSSVSTAVTDPGPAARSANLALAPEVKRTPPSSPPVRSGGVATVRSAQDGREVWEAPSPQTIHTHLPAALDSSLVGGAEPSRKADEADSDREAWTLDQLIERAKTENRELAAARARVQALGGMEAGVRYRQTGQFLGIPIVESVPYVADSTELQRRLCEMARREQAVVAAVKAAVAELLYAQRGLAELKLSHDEAKRVVEDARRRLPNGSDASSDLLRAEVALTELDHERAELERVQRHARARLAALLHWDDPDHLRLADHDPGLITRDATDPQALCQEIERLVAQVADTNPGLQAAAWIAHSPATAAGGAAALIAATLDYESARDGSIMAIRALGAEALALAHRLESTRQRILPRVAQAWTLAREDYLNGSIEYQTLRDTQNEWHRARLNHHRLDADLSIALARLEQAVGRELDTRALGLRLLNDASSPDTEAQRDLGRKSSTTDSSSSSGMASEPQPLPLPTLPRDSDSPPAPTPSAPSTPDLGPIDPETTAPSPRTPPAFQPLGEGDFDPPPLRRFAPAVVEDDPAPNQTLPDWDQAPVAPQTPSWPSEAPPTGNQNTSDRPETTRETPTQPNSSASPLIPPATPARVGPPRGRVVSDPPPARPSRTEPLPNSNTAATDPGLDFVRENPPAATYSTPTAAPLAEGLELPEPNDVLLRLPPPNGDPPLPRPADEVDSQTLPPSVTPPQPSQSRPPVTRSVRLDSVPRPLEPVTPGTLPIPHELRPWNRALDQVVRPASILTPTNRPAAPKVILGAPQIMPR